MNLFNFHDYLYDFFFLFLRYMEGVLDIFYLLFSAVIMSATTRFGFTTRERMCGTFKMQPLIILSAHIVFCSNTGQHLLPSQLIIKGGIVEIFYHE